MQLYCIKQIKDAIRIKNNDEKSGYLNMERSVKMFFITSVCITVLPADTVRTQVIHQLNMSRLPQYNDSTYFASLRGYI